ncbi:MAG: FAD-binding oxidoreductase [Mailhella sp.]|nr:FAD-binding oxidoreductase [Mailhella sp.]
MPHKGPHISISADFVVNRVLRINLSEFEAWPESVRQLAIEIAEELFLVAYNPFISAESVRASVSERFAKESQSLAQIFVTAISEGITLFWSAHEAESRFRDELVARLKEIFPDECVITRPAALVETATDATDLRLELPLLVVEPDTVEHVSALVRLANEMKFAVIPRGGGSGMTGGAVPIRKRSVIVNMTRFTGMEFDEEHAVMTCQAGVITQDAADFAESKGLLFTVDPASKTASTIGGNVAENSGGPFCFEYGTTLDNLLSWRMVIPTGEIIRIDRVRHPRHKIMPDEKATFEVRDLSGGLRSVVELRGDEIRLPGLGKDVTNKVLGGLPGMQKEGVDGIITDATFILHPKPAFSRVMCLEIFGRSMKPAMELVGSIVKLRDRIRTEGDYARISAMEEFNIKYVQAINYKRKSTRHTGDPISVIIVQVDGDDAGLLDSAVNEIIALVGDNEFIAVSLAKDAKEGAVFWEDRHKTSAIAKRTSGFKMNEDVVLPMERIPDFAHFLEKLNLRLAASAYRYALQEVMRLPGFPVQEKDCNAEFLMASALADGEDSDQIDDEIEIRAVLFMGALCDKYPALAGKIRKITEYMKKSRVIVASHMHAGDGNCHVNIPVNSNDPHMLAETEDVVNLVMAEAQRMGGAVSGEHGIGITKIAFLEQAKMDELRVFKERVDPAGLLNPGKLVQRELPAHPFTFSFNRLIEDVRQSGLEEKERFIDLLTTIQGCTRCGKCKQVCPMVYPERSYQYHPRNKNMVLGAITEAVYYSQAANGKPDPALLEELRLMVEHCTGCGRCTSVCPVKIESAKVALAMLAFLKAEGLGGHPIKSTVLGWLSQNPAARVPKVAKAAAVGQKIGNTVLGLVPRMWRDRFESPMFSGKGPSLGITDIYHTLRLDQGGFFVPQSLAEKARSGETVPAVLYFPGCGGALFYQNIALSALALLLRSGTAVVMPEKHLCCGYPLLCSGADGDYRENIERNRQTLTATVQAAAARGLRVSALLTACGSCRDSLSRHELRDMDGQLLQQMDVVQYLDGRLGPVMSRAGQHLLYHGSCHPEWADVKAVTGGGKNARALERLSGATLTLNTGCCGESGTGAYTSPGIYNALRERKTRKLLSVLPDYEQGSPILVGCPSCKIGIARNLLGIKDAGRPDLAAHPVLHCAEWLADAVLGDDWRNEFKRAAFQDDRETGLRIV